MDMFGEGEMSSEYKGNTAMNKGTAKKHELRGGTVVSHVIASKHPTEYRSGGVCQGPGD